MALHEVEAVLPPPDAPVEVPGPADWAEAEAELGVVVPDDYKAFVGRYGTGKVSDFLFVLNPAAVNPHLRLATRAADILGGMRRIRDDYPAWVPHPLPPEPGGLVLWDVTDNGNYLFWRPATSHRPAAVLVVGFRAVWWGVYEASVTTFLAGVLGRTRRCDQFPTGFPSARPRFVPTGGPPPTPSRP